MKTHVLTQCQNIPQNEKLAFVQYDEDKANTKRLQHEYEVEQAKLASAQRAAKAKLDEERRKQEGGNAVSVLGSPPVNKKLKKEHHSVTAHHGPPPPLPSPSAL
jgi:predicted carbohydrate-binding protein with CBM5 and CBM33 domain